MFVTSDTHWYHSRILEYCDRPFKSVEKMNQALIKNWNKAVGEYDVIFHLGDVGFGSKKHMADLIQQLNGYKILIMGNHDKRRSVGWWLDVGFQEVYKKPVPFQNIIFSHEPVSMEKLFDYDFNIHGHTHLQCLEDDRYINVSVDVTEFIPVDLGDMIYARYI